MGLMVHSLQNIPESKNRDYLIYLLDYGWDEPISKALRDNFDKMAEIAAKNRAVVIKGTELAHFENEVFSWHHINNEKADELLPALLITNKHPKYFLENNNNLFGKRGLVRADEYDDMKLILIPLKRFCTTTTEVVTLIQKVFSDIVDKKDLSDFQIAKEMKKGVGNALVDALILEPNISGVGFSLKKFFTYLNQNQK
jgi:hypothetical protein